VAVPLAAWLVTSVPLGLARHLALQSNAYDLSVFDYALWSTLRGAPGHVPFFGHSLWSHHVMPALCGLLPLYALFPSPVLLIAVQFAAVALAAVLLGMLARRHLSPGTACAVVAAFLFSQRTHSAVASPFYVESLEPALIFGLVLAADRFRWRMFWVLTVLALGCKEDMAVYLLPYGIFLFWREGRRSAGAAVVALSAAWLAVSLAVVIPAARAADGIPTANPFFQDRYQGDADSAAVPARVAGQLLSSHTAATIVTVTSQTAFLCVAGGAWAAIPAAGALINLAARPDTLQAGLYGHYIWPLLPWIFMATVAGAAAVIRRWSTAEPWLVAALLGLTAFNSPLPRAIWKTPAVAELRAAGVVRDALHAIPAAASVSAMPNLIPHIGHRPAVSAIGRDLNGGDADYVALSLMGDLWPLDRAGVDARIEAYRKRADYELLKTGDLFLFRKLQPRDGAR
jgi:uncharacterized membrane protein